eukprot:1147821-Pelagomonas_calceolata.AAC.5
MDGPQLVATAHGLASLQATPSPAWLSLFWGTSQSQMAEGQLSKLSQLSMAATAAARFQQLGASSPSQEGYTRKGGVDRGQGGEVAGGAGKGAPRKWLQMLAAAAAATCAKCGVEAPAVVVEEYQGWREQQEAIQQQQQGVDGEASAGAISGTPAQAAQLEGTVLSDSSLAAAAAPADAIEQQRTSDASGPAPSAPSPMDTTAPVDAAAPTGPSDSASAGSKDAPVSNWLSFELGFEPLSAQDAVGFVRACHELGQSAELDQAWVVRLLLRAAGADADGQASHAGKGEGVALWLNAKSWNERHVYAQSLNAFHSEVVDDNGGADFEDGE